MYKVVIRPLEISDAEVSWKWRNDEVVWKFTGSKPQNKITLEVELEWIKKVINEENSKRFAILVDDIYVGNIQLTNIQKGETGEYHIFIGNKEYWNKGIAKYATSQIIKYAKNILNLKKLFLYVNPNHLHAIKLYNKCKFVKVSDEVKMELDLSNSITPMVSIFCMVYNHEPFIRDCLDGFLMQKCNFDYEIVLGEDCSTDNSRGIILEYANKFPEKFKLLLNDKNIGAAQNQKIVFENCSGKYIAMCEGDDYWIDPLKLQKQVDFLEKNEGYNLITTNVKIQENNIIQELPNKSHSYTFNFVQQSLSNQCATCSVLLRKNAFDPRDFTDTEHLKIGDIFLWCLLLRDNKKGYYLHEETAIYRLHSGGLYSSIDLAEKKYNEIEVFNFIRNTRLFSRKEIGYIKIKLMYLWYDILINHSEKNRMKPLINVVKNYSIANKPAFNILLKTIFRYFKHV